MRKIWATLLALVIHATSWAGCCGDDCQQSVDIGFGVRGDVINWKVGRVDTSSYHTRTASHIDYEDIMSYTINGKARWWGQNYYIRLSGMYGLTDKGRAKELFRINDDFLSHSVSADASNPIKRRSEVFDFDLAIGYPFSFYCCQLNVVPVVGVAFHRQRLRVKRELYSSCCPESPLCKHSCSGSTPCHCGGSDSSGYSCFWVDSSSNPFEYTPSYNPFESSSSSSDNIAGELGLITCKDVDNYRFTWFGPYVGVDLAYALDGCWTLFSEVEIHFADRCNRKRKSWTGVRKLDSYHHMSWAYGADLSIGATLSLCDCWFSTLTVGYKWFSSYESSNHDSLRWHSASANLTLGYIF